METTTGSPPKFDTYLNSWSELARARRERTFARNRVRKIKERYERELPKAEADLAKCDATVRYYEELAKVDASEATG